MLAILVSMYTVRSRSLKRIQAFSVKNFAGSYYKSLFVIINSALYLTAPKIASVALKVHQSSY